MKFKLFFTAIFFFAFATAFSQKVHLGIKAGVNLNKLTGESFDDQFSFGYHLGGYLQIKLGEKMMLQPEVLFNQINVDTASKFNQLYKPLLSTGASDIKLSYLTIPILLNYKLSKFLSIQAGPQFGIITDQNSNMLKSGEDAFKKGDFSLLGGVQINFSAFNIYARYAAGLSNLNDIDKQDKWKSQTIQAGIGMKIL